MNILSSKLVLFMECLVVSTTGVLAAPQTGMVTDSRDGQSYKTITVGSQIWMAQNLNYEKEGSFALKKPLQMDRNDPMTKFESGRFYTWKDADGICPEGWHVPTADDWKYFSSNSGVDPQGRFVNVASEKWLLAGKYLEKEKHGNDAVGFEAMPYGLFAPTEGNWIHLQPFHKKASDFAAALGGEGTLMNGSADFLGSEKADDEHFVGYSVHLPSAGVALEFVDGSAYPVRCVKQYRYITDERDGQKYPVVKIGKQQWLAENVRFHTPNSLCIVDESQNCRDRYYSFSEAKKACPMGTRLPTAGDFQELDKYMESIGLKDGNSKADFLGSFWWDSSNKSGFTAKPSGLIVRNGDSKNVRILHQGSETFFWSSSIYEEIANGKIYYWIHQEGDSGKSAQLAATDEDNTMNSVRCLVLH